MSSTRDLVSFESSGTLSEARTVSEQPDQKFDCSVLQSCQFFSNERAQSARSCVPTVASQAGGSGVSAFDSGVQGTNGLFG
jgi:hypothetical protein